MAITTLDQAITGMQPARYFHKVLSGVTVINRPFSTWGLAGIPGAGSYDTTLNGVVLDSTSALVNGQIPHINPVSGNSYLARFHAVTTATPSQILLCDRLWHNGGYTITSTAAQNSTTPTWPARDVNGSTDGDGVFIGLEISVVTGAAASTLTLSYTNSAGTASRTGSALEGMVATSLAGTFYPITLQAGDTGVRSVQSLTRGTSLISGTINLVAYRVIASIESNSVGFGNSVDLLTSGFPRIYDGTVPFLMFVPGATTTTPIMGTYIETQG